MRLSENIEDCVLMTCSQCVYMIRNCVLMTCSQYVYMIRNLMKFGVWKSIQALVGCAAIVLNLAVEDKSVTNCLARNDRQTSSYNISDVVQKYFVTTGLVQKYFVTTGLVQKYSVTTGLLQDYYNSIALVILGVKS